MAINQKVTEMAYNNLRMNKNHDGEREDLLLKGNGVKGYKGLTTHHVACQGGISTTY